MDMAVAANKALFCDCYRNMGILWCSKSKAFCERPFTLHHLQLENDEQNVDVAPADAHVSVPYWVIHKISDSCRRLIQSTNERKERVEPQGETPRRFITKTAKANDKLWFSSQSSQKLYNAQERFKASSAPDKLSFGWNHSATSQWECELKLNFEKLKHIFRTKSRANDPVLLLKSCVWSNSFDEVERLQFNGISSPSLNILYSLVS